MRYIELNPVRARMVASPGEYPWSSFRANACGAHDALVAQHAVYRQLGETSEDCQSAYRALIRAAIQEEELCAIRDASQHAWALGSEAFRRRINALSRRAERLPTGRPRKRKRDARESRV